MWSEHTPRVQEEAQCRTQGGGGLGTKVLPPHPARGGASAGKDKPEGLPDPLCGKHPEQQTAISRKRPTM